MSFPSRIANESIATVYLETDSCARLPGRASELPWGLHSARQPRATVGLEVDGSDRFVGDPRWKGHRAMLARLCPRGRSKHLPRAAHYPALASPMKHMNRW